MTVLQTYNAPQGGLYDDRAQAFELGHLFGIFKRRIFYFAIPFVLLLITGLLVVAIQRPIYHAEGKILVESPEIPTDLVEPTVTSAATERIQVIQQRLMARDSLLPIVNKYNLFPSQRQWMSGTQLLDLMRERSEIQLIDLNMLISGGKPLASQLAKNSAVAFTVSFEYENPDLAAKVANDFLTSILDEDARARTDHATQTTEFLSLEVKRLQAKLDAINGQIFEIKRQAADPTQGSQEVPEQLKLQMDQLATLKASLIQAAAVYSDEHPVVKALKKRLAALQQQISQAPKAAPVAAAPEKDIDALTQQQEAAQQDLDIASKKLTAATLGESMERNQQSEHLQVLEQPITPQKPIKPNRPKLFAASFALAAVAGLGMVFLAEMLDKTIRGSQELASVVDRHLLVAIPYIPTAGEVTRRKRKIILLWAALALFLLAGLVAALYIGVTIDFSWFDQSWIDSLTRLSK
jgi:uncharacterized protein involved in exopolysaccharide biosynthesis